MIFITSYLPFAVISVQHLSSVHFPVTFTVLFAQNILLPFSKHYHLIDPDPLGLSCLLCEAAQGLISLSGEGLTGSQCMMGLNPFQ